MIIVYNGWLQIGISITVRIEVEFGIYKKEFFFFLIDVAEYGTI